MIPINDARLTDTMDRVRSGSTQLFREKLDSKGEPYRTFMTNDSNGVIQIDPPERHLFAELISGSWFWVNGCDLCNKKPETFGSYVRCEEHNRCHQCKTKRSEIKESSVWGHRLGFECNKCHDANEAVRKSEARARISKEYDAWDYSRLETITCPWCDHEVEEYWRHMESENEDFDIKCKDCDNKFHVEPELSIRFSMKR